MGTTAELWTQGTLSLRGAPPPLPPPYPPSTFQTYIIGNKGKDVRMSKKWNFQQVQYYRKKCSVSPIKIRTKWDNFILYLYIKHINWEIFLVHGHCILNFVFCAINDQCIVRINYEETLTFFFVKIRMNHLYIYFACLSVYNKRQNGWMDWAQMLWSVGPHMTTGKVYRCSE